MTAPISFQRKQAYINFVDFLDECEGWLDYYTEIIIDLKLIADEDIDTGC